MKGLRGFRGDFPAASLKRMCPRARLGAAGLIPRGLPRGLIEANTDVLTLSRLRFRFRGDFPAASLKLTIKLSTETIGIRFRGDFPAASLKRWCRDAGIQSRCRFRGDFPAASLKLAPTAPTRPDFLGIPRGLPRGLIEAQPRVWGPQSPATSIPRGLPRGLIEASRARASPTTPRAIPRGLPRGLIEASPAAPSSSAAASDSAGTSPRPH